MGTWAELPSAPTSGSTSNGCMILNDGRLLWVQTSLIENSTRFIVLTPSSTGSYEDGTWGPVLTYTITSHFGGAMVLMNDGKVLIFGSHGQYRNPGGITEYDPVTHTARDVTGELGFQRSHDTGGGVAVLDDGSMHIAFGVLDPVTAAPQLRRIRVTQSRAVTSVTTNITPEDFDATIESGHTQLPDGRLVSFLSGWFNPNRRRIRVTRPSYDAAFTAAGSFAGDDTYVEHNNPTTTVPSWMSWYQPDGSWIDKSGTGHELGGTIWMPKIGRVVQIGSEATELMTWNPATPGEYVIAAQTIANRDRLNLTRTGTIPSDQAGVSLASMLADNVMQIDISSGSTPATIGGNSWLFIGLPNNRWAGFRFAAVTDLGNGRMNVATNPSTVGLSGAFNDIIPAGSFVYVFHPNPKTADGYAAILPSGDLFYIAGFAIRGNFPTEGVRPYTWDGVNPPVDEQPPALPLGGSWVTVPFSATTAILPSGKVVVGHSTDPRKLRTFTDDKPIDNTLRPIITDFPDRVESGFRYRLSGQQLFGRHVGVSQSEDFTGPCNHPVVRLTNQQTGVVLYQPTFNYSDRSIAPNRPSTCEVAITAPPGIYTMEVISSGVPSLPTDVVVDGTVGGGDITILRYGET